eukprot:6026569-Pyramimonas_sp.AAC.2
MYGDITFKAAQEMRKPEVVDFFAKCIQRVVPKSYKQAVAEVVVSRYFLENFCGDQVRSPIPHPSPPSLETSKLRKD